MRIAIANVHERVLPVDMAQVGRLLDTLASEHDGLWPLSQWPPMRFDEGLEVGARGGHGPIHYAVSQLEPGRRVRFRFIAPTRLEGEHCFEVVPNDDATTILRHSVLARPSGAMTWQWPLIFGPLHDALLEDALARAHRSLTGAPAATNWSAYVRLLRWLLRRRR